MRPAPPDLGGEERRRRLAAARIYLVLTTSNDAEGWRPPLLAALQGGGVDILQLRDKRGDEDALVDTAASLQKRCRALNVLFVLNDRPDVAADLDLDGAHVGQEDVSVREARLRLGPDRLLGLSTHDAGEVRAARSRTDVDYVGLGPCFPTDSKMLVRAPGAPALVAACAPVAGDLPVFPIGGITPANIAALAAAGATRAAVGAGILEAADPVAAVRALRAAWTGA